MTFAFDPHDWSMDKASNQRMVYVPKDAVTEFMKKVSPNVVGYMCRLRLSLTRGSTSTETMQKDCR